MKTWGVNCAKVGGIGLCATRQRYCAVHLKAERGAMRWIKSAFKAAESRGSLEKMTPSYRSETVGDPVRE